MDIEVLPLERALGDAAPTAVRTGDGQSEVVVVVRVSGELDLYTAPRLRGVLADLLPPVRRTAVGTAGSSVPVLIGRESSAAGPPVRGVVVDLSGVSFVDSYSLGVLVHGHRLARPGGRAYALVSTSDLIRGLFEVTGLSRVLPLHPDVSTALLHLRPAAQSVS